MFGLGSNDTAIEAQPNAGPEGPAPWFHCGEPRPSDGLAQNGRHFCCPGCLTVHNLLDETGLGHFYDLASHPGIRIKTAGRLERRAYLDEPAGTPRRPRF